MFWPLIWSMHHMLCVINLYEQIWKAQLWWWCCDPIRVYMVWMNGLFLEAWKQPLERGAQSFISLCCIYCHIMQKCIIIEQLSFRFTIMFIISIHFFIYYVCIFIKCHVLFLFVFCCLTISERFTDKNAVSILWFPLVIYSHVKKKVHHFSRLRFYISGDNESSGPHQPLKLGKLVKDEYLHMTCHPMSLNKDWKKCVKNLVWFRSLQGHF